MNETVSSILSHRSIRKFTQTPVTGEQRDLILKSAVAASTSSHLQSASIIRITDAADRRKLAELAGGQPYVAAAPEFFVFCMDFNRHHQIAPEAALDSTELTLTGAIDAALMAQNALLAAESLGLGGVFIGGIRSNLEAVCQLLELPRHVIPLFGLCIGYPAQDPEVKPRLPLSITVHENRYHSVDPEQLAQYDQQMREYYSRRGAEQPRSWTDQVRKNLKYGNRRDTLDVLQKQGFSLK